ncbi:DsbA family oxidoreductase [Tenuibacillus multivorans]|uniref:Predicted dithiol-disulfide isomerase, DsbA family n=1 Tax=Tenuibacillus multivorans TaxID=237069 RepID=A0A1G9WER1_9BACI|nr:DsbA family oxidoreductase [Tenuibacillus multivorans]GEL76430.1 DSBA oxidoreductase [Tenuibacillus multivorans]SDM82988.1 Predicted dithiol-disulfide isomerase, DsbA family [Tenuibacillus multivorans]
MNVEIWSDVVCPFCYIGRRRLEQAMNQFEHDDKVSLTYKSYQLDPNAEKDPGYDIHEMLATKYGVPYEEGKKMNDRMAEQAKEVGLEFNLDQVIPTNTEDAHRLSHYANEHGKMYALMENMMRAYFTDGQNVGDHNVLADLAEEVGLNREEALEVLKTSKHKREVANNQQEAMQIGVQGVPFFVFNEKYAVFGAQPTDVFLEVLEKVYEEEKSEPKIQVLNGKKSQTEYCDDDSCST